MILIKKPIAKLHASETRLGLEAKKKKIAKKGAGKINDKLAIDIKRSEPNVKSLMNLILKLGIKDGQSVYSKEYSPKNGWYWELVRFNYYHPIYGLYPNLKYKTGGIANLLMNKITIKKTVLSI